MSNKGTTSLSGLGHTSLFKPGLGRTLLDFTLLSGPLLRPHPSSLADAGVFQSGTEATHFVKTGVHVPKQRQHAVYYYRKNNQGFNAVSTKMQAIYEECGQFK
jgi:hypothetical protein